MFLAKSQKVRIDQIKVEDRQRKEIDTDHIAGIARSIKARGLIHPIVLTKDFRLIAGQCRIEAYKVLGLEEIEARFNNSEDPAELEIIELEENVRRKNLSWQEEADAVRKLHQRYVELDPKWTEAATADVVGYAPGHVNDLINIAGRIATGDARFAKAERLSEARTALKRERGKQVEDLTNALFQGKGEARTPPSNKPVMCGDFIEWASRPQSRKFSVIHCDFPYGVKMQKSGQVSKALGTYDDDPETFFNLLQAFVKNYSNFALPVSHIMFWFSQKFRRETEDMLSNIPEARVFPYMLIWHKSDGRGMLPDPMREGRRTYETALLVSVGDRKIVRPVNNSFAHSLDENRDHVSRKPPAVIEHFLQMLVEPGVHLLDPTCGSGSALVAGRALGADVFGIEKDPEYVERIKL